MMAADHQRDIVSRPLGSRRAVTLVEMVVSLGITSIILCACGSVMLITNRAISISAAGPVVSTALANAAADQVAADLKMALQITERTATAVTFTVPDRNGDSLPETLRYAWAGPGSPLTRQYNGQPVPAAVVADNVQLFNLDWLTKTVGQPPQPPALPPEESPEQVLACRDWTGGGRDFSDYTIKSSAWAAEYFKPNLPGNAVSWKITRVKVKLQRNASYTGTLTIQIRLADAGKKPIGGVLDSGSVNVASLSSTMYTWVEFPFSSLAGLSPASGMCLLATTTDTQPGVVRYDKKGTGANMAWCTSGKQGAWWSTPTSGDAMQIYVYGTVTTQP